MATFTSLALPNTTTAVHLTAQICIAKQALTAPAPQARPTLGQKHVTSRPPQIPISMQRPQNGATGSTLTLIMSVGPLKEYGGLSHGTT